MLKSAYARSERVSTCSSRLGAICCWRSSGHAGDHQGAHWRGSIGTVLTLASWDDDAASERIVVVSGKP